MAHLRKIGPARGASHACISTTKAYNNVIDAIQQSDDLDDQDDLRLLLPEVREVMKRIGCFEG